MRLLCPCPRLLTVESILALYVRPAVDRWRQTTSRIAGAVEAQDIGAAVGRGDGDHHVRPSDADEVPAAFRLRETEGGLSDIGPESPLIRETHHAASLAVDALVRDEVEGDLARRAGRDRAKVRARIGPFLGAGDLQHVLASLLRRHAELALGRPGLDPCHGRAGTEVVMHGLAIEGDGHLHMAAAVQVDLD